jgi:hypothetical protein
MTELASLLTENETKLFRELKRRKKIELDDLLKEFRGVSRQSMIVRIKYLAAKVAPHGWVIERVSPVGRGAKAIYSTEKRY